MNKIHFLLLALLASINGLSQQRSLPEIGVVQDIENDSLLQTIGYDFLVENTTKLLSPRVLDETQFQEKLAVIRRSRIPVYACNIFIPGELKVVGPLVDKDAVLEYVNKVFYRAKQAGITMIIWGSGASRRIPNGFAQQNAKVQFVSIAKQIAVIAARYDIIVALENLNTTEVNFITTVKESLDIVKSVDHKNLRLCIDIYHMLKENEPPDIILDAKGYAVYCELAEKEARTPPGVHGDNFRPYLSALRKIGFDGKISIECRWKDLGTQGDAAYREIYKQISEVFSE